MSRYSFFRGSWFLAWLVSGLVALNMLAVLATAVGLYEAKSRGRYEAELKSRDLSRAVAIGADELIDKIDLSLRAAIDDVEQNTGSLAGGVGSVRDGLTRQLRLVSESAGISVIDEQGLVIAHEGRWSPMTVRVDDRAYFRMLKDGYDGLYVGTPLASRISGAQVIVLARSYRKPDGRFGGVVAIPVPLDSFRRVIADYVLGENGRLALLAEDLGVLVGRSPSDASTGFDTDDLPDALRSALADRPSRFVFSGVSPSDGVTRTFSVNHLSVAPLYAVCAIAENDFMSDWRKLRWESLILLGIILALSHAAAFTFYRFWRKQQRDAAVLKESNAGLESALERLSERDNILATAAGVGGFGAYSLDMKDGRWMRSPEQGAIFGVAPDFPRTREAWFSLIHEDDRPILERSIEEWKQAGKDTFDDEYRIRRPADGALRWIHGVGRLHYDAEGKTERLIGVVKDITEQKESRERIEHLAYHDILTDLPNRTLLADRLHLAQAQAARRGEFLAVCYLDLDDFKPVNQSWGRDVGDMLLIQVARRLQGCIRAGDTVARLGGDEFVVLLCGLTEEAELQSVIERMRSAIAEPYLIGGETAALTMSLGLTVYPLDIAEDADALIRHAAAARTASTVSILKATGCIRNARTAMPVSPRRWSRRSSACSTSRRSISALARFCRWKR